MVFPLEKIPPGVSSVVLQARGVGAELSANVRGTLEVPQPPKAGEARAWFLSEGLGRAGDKLALLPSLDGILDQAAGTASIVGYGCPAGGELPAARLVSLDRKGSEGLPLAWVDDEARAVDAEEGCGWIFGRVPPGLATGLWRFEPPGEWTEAVDPARPLDGGGKGSPTVEFRVATPPTASSDSP